MTVGKKDGTIKVWRVTYDTEEAEVEEPDPAEEVISFFLFFAHPTHASLILLSLSLSHSLSLSLTLSLSLSLSHSLSLSLCLTHTPL